jgi:F-box protein 11
VPGAGVVVDLVESAFDVAKTVAKDHQEAELLAKTRANVQDLERLGELLGHLTGDMAKVCSKAETFIEEDMPEKVQGAVLRALQEDPALMAAQRKMEQVCRQMSRIEEQNSELIEGMEEMRPLVGRIGGVADYAEDMKQAGVNGRFFAEMMQKIEAMELLIRNRQPDQAIAKLRELPSEVQVMPSVLTLEAGARVVAKEYAAAATLLQKATRFKPNDTELGDLSRAATHMSGMGADTKPDFPNLIPLKRFNISDVIDGFTLTARLGSGGWGQVFRATRDGQTKALKIMHPELSQNRGVLDRFKAEIRTLMRLPVHPNLVRIEEFGYCTTQNCWYLVMDYIDGPTLDGYLKTNGALSATQVKNVFQPVVEALGVAHANGIVHRDIKPGNMVFRRADKKLVIIDFGLANDSNEFCKAQVDGKTVFFAAPEQLRGRSADARSDVFSLAATMHFALEYADRDRREPDHFSAANAPAELRDAMVRSMASWGDRFAHAGELAEVFGEESKATSIGHQNELLVSADGSGNCRTVGEALLRIKSGGLIRVHGEICEESSLVLDRPVRIFGEANHKKGVIHLRGGGIVIRANGIEMMDLVLNGLNGVHPTILVELGESKIIGCDITGENSCVEITGEASAPNIFNCILHGSKNGCGVKIAKKAQGTIEGCDIFENNLAGVHIKQGSNPTLRNCKIHGSKNGCGVKIAEKALGNIDRCDIFGNKFAGIQIQEGSNPTLRNCKIHDQMDSSGVLVFDQGLGFFENCDIYGNSNHGVWIESEGNPTFSGCSIYNQTESVGLFVRDKGLGIFQRCKIFGNATAGVCIFAEGNPNLSDCKIYNHIEGNGLFVGEQGLGFLDSCIIFENTISGVAINTGGNPTLHKCKIYENSHGVFVNEKGLGVLEKCDISENKLGIVIQRKGHPTLRNCNIHHQTESDGVNVSEHGLGILEDCDIFRNKRAGVFIQEEGNPILRNCKIHDQSESSGLDVCKRGLGILEKCDIFGNNGPGVEISNYGNPTLRNCKIHDQSESVGIFVYSHGLGVLETCDIFRNNCAGIQIASEGNPNLRNCNIYNQTENNGVVVHEHGLGILECCDIFGNSIAGVQIITGGNPTLKKCKIHDHTASGGIFVVNQGLGILEGCDIFRNKQAGVVIKMQGNPTLLNCKIHDHLDSNGVYVDQDGLGVLEECDMFNNKFGVLIQKDGNPTLRKCKIRNSKVVGLHVAKESGGILKNCIFDSNSNGDLCEEPGSTLKKFNNLFN